MWVKESQESFCGEEEEAYAAAEWRFFLVGFSFFEARGKLNPCLFMNPRDFLCPLVQQLRFGFVFGIRTSIFRPLSLCCWFQLDCGLVCERSGKCRLLAKFCASEGMWNNNYECAGIAVPYRLSSAYHQEATSSLSRFLQTFFWSTTLVRNFSFVNDIHHLKHKILFINDPPPCIALLLTWRIILVSGWICMLIQSCICWAHCFFCLLVRKNHGNFRVKWVAERHCWLWTYGVEILLSCWSE